VRMIVCPRPSIPGPAVQSAGGRYTNS
jgi:hypothetical protein